MGMKTDCSQDTSKPTPLISCKQHPERNEKMTNFISTGSTYWISDEFFTQGDKDKAIFWAKKAYRNGAKPPDELKILININ